MLRKRRLLIIASLVAVLIAAVILYVSYSRGERRTSAQTPPQVGSAAGRAQIVQEPSAGSARRDGRAEATGAPVVTAAAIEQNFVIRRRTIGSLESPAVVTIRSRLDSQVLEQHVRDGQIVKKGDLLFTLDDREVRAALARAEAQLAKDRAALSRSELDLRRAQELLLRNAAPKTQLETATAENQGAIATVQADQAQIDAEKVRLSYSKIVAPIDGRIGTVRIAPGNLISANDPVGLTTLTQMQPLRVSFTLPERDLAALRAAAQQTPPTAVRVYTSGVPEQLAEGKLDFVDTSVDVASGTIAARATFPNEDLALWPGQFVDVEIDLGVRPQTVMVPTVAIQSGQQGPFLFVSTADGRAELRKVQLVASEADRTALGSGVTAGERVVVEGQMRLVNGARIAEAPGPGPSPTPSAATSSSGSSPASNSQTPR